MPHPLLRHCIRIGCSLATCCTSKSTVAYDGLEGLEGCGKVGQAVWRLDTTTPRLERAPCQGPLLTEQQSRGSTQDTGFSTPVPVVSTFPQSSVARAFAPAAAAVARPYTPEVASTRRSLEGAQGLHASSPGKKCVAEFKTGQTARRGIEMASQLNCCCNKMWTAAHKHSPQVGNRCTTALAAPVSNSSNSEAARGLGKDKTEG